MVVHVLGDYDIGLLSLFDFKAAVGNLLPMPIRSERVVASG